MLGSASASSAWYSLPTSASVKLALPPLNRIRFPPSNDPAILLPPVGDATIAAPFQIPSTLYNGALSAAVPITVGLIYITLVTVLNNVNRQRQEEAGKVKPWTFSKTRFFRLMVLTHNLLLTVYSAWTCIGMVRALAVSYVSPFSGYGLAGTVDSLCKINGPRGLGSAATYNSESRAWSIANQAFQLGADGLTPDSSDVGRIWNEGLAFYGWLFYMSKYYEVLDTFIILAKGKRSSLLQTYHHAGAMICMWAGIRYMSPPIWMFVLVNSFVHTIMYSFYFLSAFGTAVPTGFKKTLTTLQITQFVVGITYAFIHLFIKYQSPVSMPYLYHLGDFASGVITDASSSVSSLITAATVGIDWRAVAKKIALRAAGREGLAQNVVDRSGQRFGVDAKHAARDYIKREETRYRDELVWTHCLDTSGQTFAVLLNCLYLAPLTVMFVRFFIASYSKRLERRRSSTAGQKAIIAGQSSRDAVHGISRRLSEAFLNQQGDIEDVTEDFAIMDEEAREGLQETTKKVKESIAVVKQEVQTIVNKTKKSAGDASEQMSETASKISNTTQKEVEKDVAQAKERLSEAANAATKKAEQVKDDVVQTSATVKDEASKLESEAEGTVKSYSEAVKKATEDKAEHLDSPADSTHAAENVSKGADEDPEDVVADTQIKPLDSSYVQVPEKDV